MNRILVCAVVFAAFLVMLVWARSADAADSPVNQLERVASVFAQQPVTVACSNSADDPILLEAWGYVYLYDPVVHTSEYLCNAAANVTDPSYGMAVRAIAVLVLTHEAYHLRKSWSDRGNEARVECKAIRHFRYAAMMLGASPELATQLRAYALAFHWHLAARIPEYDQLGCKVPKP